MTARDELFTRNPAYGLLADALADAVKNVDFGALAEADMKAQAAAALADLIGAIDTAAATGAVTDTDLLMAYEKQLVTDLRALVTTVGTPLTAANIQTEATDAIRDVYGGGATNYQRQASKTSTFANTDLFTYTGRIMIVSITGFVTVIAGAATTLRLGITPDATAIQYMCAASASAAYGVGTLFTITGTATDAMVGTTLVGAAPSQAASWTAGCITSGTISLVSATQTGTVIWQVVWIPITAGATLVAA